MVIRPRIAVARWSVIALLAGALTAAPAGADERLLRESEPILVQVDGDAVVFQTSTTGKSGSGTSRRSVVHRDGYATLGSPVLLDQYEVRLVASERIEEVRPHVLDAAGATTAIGGQSLVVRRRVVAPGGPGRGEIDVVVSSTSPCTGRWLACGGPEFGDDDEGEHDVIVTGRIWVNPRLLELPAAQIANTIRHELGHTLGLAHYEDRHHGRVQTMHPTSFEAAVWEAGDTAGLRALSGSVGAPRVVLDGADHADGAIVAHGRVAEAPDDAVLLLEVDGEPVRRSIDGFAFRHRLDAVSGPHLVCASLERGDHISSRTCVRVTVPGEPVGHLESVKASALGVVVTGWATNERNPDPATVVVRVDDVAVDVRADEIRPDGSVGGFHLIQDIDAGTHVVCVTVRAVGGGAGADLGCRTVAVSDHSFGRVGLQTL